MRPHTEQDREEVKAMLTEGMSVAEIVEALGIPRATVYRWKKEFETPDPKVQQNAQTQPSEQTEELIARIAALEGQVDKLLESFMPIREWVTKKIREEEKAKELYESEQDGDKPRFMVGKKQ